MVSKEFLYAGRASYVVANPYGESVTVKVCKSKKKSYRFDGSEFPPCYYINVRYQNEEWTYVGVLKEHGRILITNKAKMTAEDRRFKIAQWSLTMIDQQKALPDGYRLEHTGRCGRCGRMLRDAESIRIGLGPDCEGKV